ncbi:MAG: hypothetical protein ACLFPO_02845 [Spirochaetaceae bacterium]
MSIIEALQARNPGHVIDVEEDFDPYKQHYRYFLRVDHRRTSILYSRGDLIHHTIHQHSGRLIYSALLTHIARTLGTQLQ